MRWSWIVRNRDRWGGQGDSRRHQREHAREKRIQLGLAPSQLDELGGGDLNGITPLPAWAD